MVHYRKYIGGQETIQAITVDGVLRRLIVDSDRDGYIDYELLDNDGNASSDEYLSYTDDMLMVDWPEHAAG